MSWSTFCVVELVLGVEVILTGLWLLMLVRREEDSYYRAMGFVICGRLWAAHAIILGGVSWFAFCGPSTPTSVASLVGLIVYYIVASWMGGLFFGFPLLMGVEFLVRLTLGIKSPVLPTPAFRD